MSGIAAPKGNPGALKDDVADFERVTLAIDQAADDLRTSMYESTSLAVDEIYARGIKASDSLKRAHTRYEGTTNALRDYQVELADFHTSTNRAIDDEENARYRYNSADIDYDAAAAQWRLAAREGQDQQTIEYWRGEADEALARRNNANQDLNDAIGVANRAANDLETAAQRAISRIVASFDGTNDSLKDHVNKFFADIGEFLSALAQWATDVLKAVLDAIRLALEAFILAMQALALALAALALIVILLVLVVVALALIVLVIAWALVVLATAALIIITAYNLADYLGLSTQDRIRLIALLMGVAFPVLGAVILWRITDEMLKPTPEVKPYNPFGADAEMRNAQQELDKLRAEDVDDLLRGAGLADAAGMADRTVVDIAEVRDPNGNITGYIVTLPSTMDWVIAALVAEGVDPGAINDLDPDLMIMLLPELKSQYERAVLEAMSQAGIPQGAPVLMTGWSLGGILGGHMIATDSGGYNYQGLVSAGSSIDHMNIPDNIPVLQGKHVLDGVHRTDFIEVGDRTSKHVEVWDGPFSDVGIQGSNPIEAHNNVRYVETVRSHDTDRQLSQNFEQFLVTDAEASHGWTVSHQQYQFQE